MLIRILLIVAIIISVETTVSWNVVGHIKQTTFESLAIISQEQIQSDEHWIQIRNNLEGVSLCSNILFYLIQQTSYIKQDCVGYKYFGKNQDVEIFIKNVIAYNDLKWAKITMEDSFYMKLKSHQDQSNNMSWVLVQLEIQYLSSSVIVNQIPYPLVIKQKVNGSVRVINLDKSITNEKVQQTGLIRRRIQGSGFHQKMNYTITIPGNIDFTPQCQVIIKDILPQQTYIDADQLKNVTRYQTIDIEKPAHFSTQYYYQYRVGFTELKQSGIYQYFFNHRYHFRYPKPSNSSYTLAYVPSLEQAYVDCGGQIIKLKLDLMENSGRGRIPTGNSDQVLVVTLLTFIATYLCALLISKRLRN